MALSDTVCDRVRPLLSAFVDGEIPASDAAFVESHLKECARCASEIAFFRLLHRAAAEIPLVSPRASLTARIAQATYAAPVPAPRISLRQQLGALLRPVPLGFATAGAAFAALVTVALLRQGQVAPVAVQPLSPSAAPVVATNPVVPRKTAPVTKPAVKPSLPRTDSVTNNTTIVARNNPAPTAIPTIRKPADKTSIASATPPRALPYAEFKPLTRPETAPRVDFTLPSGAYPVAKVAPAPRIVTPRAAAPRPHPIPRSEPRGEVATNTPTKTIQPETVETPQPERTNPAAEHPTPGVVMASAAVEYNRVAMSGDGRLLFKGSRLKSPESQSVAIDQNAHARQIARNQNNYTTNELGTPPSSRNSIVSDNNVLGNKQL